MTPDFAAGNVPVQRLASQLMQSLQTRVSSSWPNELRAARGWPQRDDSAPSLTKWILRPASITNQAVIGGSHGRQHT